ncbi:hypothetical protein JCM11251_002964 [Rhodosporidiobolus azoricus]
MAAMPPDTPSQQIDGITPQKLAELWKKQGGFDSLRKQLLADFLASPDRDALLTRLDTLLPLVLSQTPSLPRLARKDRPATALAEVERRDALKETMDKLEVRLRSTRERDAEGKRIGSRAKEGRRIERELGNALRKARGVEEMMEESEESEVEEAVVVKKEETAPSPAPSASAALVQPLALNPTTSLPPASASLAPLPALTSASPVPTTSNISVSLPVQEAGADEQSATVVGVVKEEPTGEHVEMKDGSASVQEEAEDVVVKMEPETA